MSEGRGRRGKYGLDGHYPRTGMAVQATLVAGAAAATVWAARRRRPLLATATGIAAAGLAELTAGFLYTTLRGKFAVWSELLDQLDLGGDEQLLDVGCGRGAVLLLAAERLPRGRAVGADIWRAADQSGNSQAAAERNAAREGVAGRVELMYADARDLPFDDGTFDVVLSNLAVHNIPGDEGKDRAITEAVRVLRPGGRLCVVDFHAGWLPGALRKAGCHQVTARPLDWRMWFGSPLTATSQVTARKPEPRPQPAQS
jgi:arsenite methyltransferase